MGGGTAYAPSHDATGGKARWTQVTMEQHHLQTCPTSQHVSMALRRKRASEAARDGSLTMLHSARNSGSGEGGSMDILVMLEENPEHSPVLAHVNSVPSPLDVERPSRDIVTLYGEA